MFEVHCADNVRLGHSHKRIVIDGKNNYSHLDKPNQCASNDTHYHVNFAYLVRVGIICQRCLKRHYVSILMTALLIIGTLYFYVTFQELARDLNELRVQITLLQGKANNRIQLYRHKGLSSAFTMETTKTVSSNREDSDFYDFFGSDNLPHNRYNEKMKGLHVVRKNKQRQEVQDFRGRVSINRLHRKRRSPKQIRKEKDKNTKKPAIELEGYKTSDGKQAWKLAEWVPKRNQYLDHFNGEIIVKKSGLYLMYAQITLIGSRKRGFYVKKMSRTADGTYVASIISACTRFSDEEESSSRNDSCSVHRPCRLDAGDKLFIEPILEQEILYSSSYTYFGLIRMV
ncbi:hypothetical protein CHS0354_002213 [Potamilus streckersoni]|uniref:THD domain-containing protein n=1 Tax=Potamilus streckersoni TaxID=2493646 RepID=A0AAE0VHM9_9BIVA|nr:hypothetical protein CHS0354_002213 [Potamilus streckersoni]